MIKTQYLVNFYRSRGDQSKYWTEASLRIVNVVSVRRRIKVDSVVRKSIIKVKIYPVIKSKNLKVYLLVVERIVNRAQQLGDIIGIRLIKI